ncbi:hypothetical protein Poly24_51990 [Rosistilla carotiformis]|uniref:Glycosyl transferase family 2 n=1 Tax=Rosistilla carotiformis TaxID=2528017 RepID=A0A518K0Z4_9BACT|nr:glycosyltransferase family A protein [Rosistilla carotiformis]QDV71463.1 hypothetical protein Poly24_51990 [Rosistilla carotiformis]
MPRLSIIIPLRSHSEDFETTLVSVLENRPDDCEVIVAHDGSYEDPFELAGEVCFAVGSDCSLLNLVRAGSEIATSPIVHVLADGFQATAGWTDYVDETFADHDVACASPLVCDMDDHELILAAGWANHALRLRRPIASGATAVGRLEAARISGLFLAASFWKVSALRQLLKARSVATAADFEAVCARWLKKEDYQIQIAVDSRVTTYEDAPELESVGFRTGFQLHCASPASGVPATIGFAMLSCLTQPHRISSWTTAAGRIAASIWGGKRRHAIDRDLKAILSASISGTSAFEDETPQTLAFPVASEPLRRAA